jgi:bifunctional non-homologous end joining protein LigD
VEGAFCKAAAVPPMMANCAKEPFDDPNWIFEPKLDGYRVIAVIDERGSPNLWSRNLIGHLRWRLRPVSVTFLNVLERDR